MSSAHRRELDKNMSIPVDIVGYGEELPIQYL
jgi:hypothetical protein